MLQVSEEEDTPITTRNEEEIKILFFFLTTLKHFIADLYLHVIFMYITIILNKSKQEIIIITINKKSLG